jgi:hypothetical protein
MPVTSSSRQHGRGLEENDTFLVETSTEFQPDRQVDLSS